MSTTRLRWLLVIVVAELLIIVGLVAWAVTKDDAPSPQATPATSTTAGGSLTASLIATGLKAPTNIIATPSVQDNRLFVTERDGTIKTINKNSGEAVAPFLDIASKVKDNGAEMGLLGLAFHPTFEQNGFFYVNYTNKEDFTIIARYKADAAGKADPASEKVLLKIKQPYENHNGGGLAFGSDGFLYIALGDGGAGGDPENRGQNKAELLGKILRIDVDTGDPYAIPASNPFANEAGTKPEIWAWGLRNPWRISFDKTTNDFYIADVGQGKIEEVNFQKATSKGGENYGWRCFEGTQTFNNAGCKDAKEYVMPVFEYAQEGTKRCSITGGYVYRGMLSPNLTGKYIYGDFCSGEILSAEQKDGTWSQNVILKTPYAISTFGQDSSGELYVADLTSGSIYHLGTD